MKRFVVHSEERGVYLGGGLWSKDEYAYQKDSAPTFEEGGQLVEFLKANKDIGGLGFVESPGVGDRPGFRVSMDKCAELGLPRWGKDGAPKPTKEPAKTDVGAEEVKGHVGGKKKAK